MALFNHSTRELTAKIVYYGPGLCGKTTNLKVLHGRLEKAQAGKLLSLSTAQDRTIYFDLLPVELGNIKGYTVRFQLCTVPGQVFYNETRKIVLRGVDGLVFVVDSQWSMLSHNLESFQNLRENLHDEKISLESLPLVVQYNKRDLPSALSVEALQDSLNFHSYPFVEAVASEGVGVAETFKLVSKLTFVDLLRRLQKGARLPAESTAPGDRKTATLPPAVPQAPPPTHLTMPVPAVEAPGAVADVGDSAASWAVPSADGIFADLSEEPPLESSLVTDTLTPPPGVPAEASAPAAAAEPDAGSSLVGAAAATSGAPVLEAQSDSVAPSVETIREEAEERRSQRTWRPRFREPVASLDEKLNDALEEARKAAQHAAARRPPLSRGEDASTQEISAARIRDQEMREVKKLVEDGLEATRTEASERAKALEGALEKLRDDVIETKRAFERLRDGTAEEKKALEKTLEERLANVRSEEVEERRLREEAFSIETSRREEAEKAARERIATLDEELRNLRNALDEAKAEMQANLSSLKSADDDVKAEMRAKVDLLKSAADDATKKWVAALRKTLEEFGE